MAEHQGRSIDGIPPLGDPLFAALASQLVSKLVLKDVGVGKVPPARTDLKKEFRRPVGFPASSPSFSWTSLMMSRELTSPARSTRFTTT